MQYLLFFVCYSLHRHVIYTNGISAAAVVATALATPASIALTRRVGWCSLKTMLQFSLMNTFIIWKIINYTSSTLQPEQSLYLVSCADSERVDSAIQLAGTCFLFSLLCWLQHEIIDHRSLFLFNSHIHEHIHHADYFHFPNELMLTENCFFRYSRYFFLQQHSNGFPFGELQITSQKHWKWSFCLIHTMYLINGFRMRGPTKWIHW